MFISCAWNNLYPFPNEALREELSRFKNGGDDLVPGGIA